MEPLTDTGTVSQSRLQQTMLTVVQLMLEKLVLLGILTNWIHTFTCNLTQQVKAGDSPHMMRCTQLWLMVVTSLGMITLHNLITGWDSEKEPNAQWHPFLLLPLSWWWIFEKGNNWTFKECLKLTYDIQDLNRNCFCFDFTSLNPWNIIILF